MIADYKDLFKTWKELQGKGIKRPVTEADYLELLDLLNNLTDHYNCNAEPYASLFDLVASYMHEWELTNEPELKHVEVPGHRMLAFYMEQQGLSQYQLAKEGIADQSTLSKILQGKRQISKTLAKKLAERFHVNPSVFF